MKSILLITSLAVSACVPSAAPLFVREVQYDFVLATVERPAETKQRWGNVESVEVAEEDRYRYVDDLIDVTIGALPDQFVFALRNQTEHSIKLVWDETVFIDLDGSSTRVMHQGVRYADRNVSQPASVIPAGAGFSDIVLPSDRVWFREGTYGTYASRPAEWRHLNLVMPAYEVVRGTATPGVPAPAAADTLLSQARENIGKRMGLLMPFEIQGVVNEYTFWFEVKDATPMALVPTAQHRLFR